MRRSKACLYIGEKITGTSSPSTSREPISPRAITLARLYGSHMPTAYTRSSCSRTTVTWRPATNAATGRSGSNSWTQHTNWLIVPLLS